MSASTQAAPTNRPVRMEVNFLVCRLAAHTIGSAVGAMAAAVLRTYSRASGTDSSSAR